MPFTTPALKANGGTISRAEVVDFLENLEWFYIPPAYRVYSQGTLNLSTTLTEIDFSPGGLWHPEWREGGGGVPNDTTYDTGGGGLYLLPGDVAGGLWANGVMIAVRNVVSVVGGQAPRSLRVQLRRGTGAVWTELADYVNEDKNSGRRGAVHLSGLGTFNTTTDRVEVRAQASTGTPAVVADRRWGVRFGSETNLANAYAAARQISDTNDETVGAFNRLRINQLRIERRPSGQRWKSADTAITGGVLTQVPLGERDWSTPDSIAPTTGSTSIMTIPTSGIWLVTGQVTYDNYDSGASVAEAVLLKNDTNTLVANTNAPEANNYDTVVPVVDLVQMTAGDELELWARSGTNSTVQAGRGTTMSATLMSSNVGVSPGRQVFARMPEPATWPKVADMSSGRSPAGAMRVLSDLTDRQWHRPAYKAQLTDDTEIKMSSGWVNVDVDELLFDYTSLEATHDVTLLSGGALVLPWPGIWMVGARLQFSAQSVEGVNVGNIGVRGMRLALGEKAAAGAFIGAAMNAASHSWSRTVMETVVVNREEGQEVRLQGLAAVNIGPASSLVAAAGTSITNISEAAVAITDLAETIDESDYEIPVVQAHIWCVELGEGITRVPR